MSFNSRKGRLDPHAGSNHITFHVSSPVGTVQFPSSLGSHLYDVRWRVRLVALYFFLKQCDSVPKGGSQPAGRKLPTDSDNDFFYTVQPPPHHYGQNLLETIAPARLPF